MCHHARIVAMLLLVPAWPLAAAQVVLEGPVGSSEFGLHVYVLPNGNLVVTDPTFSGIGSATGIGAVHLLRPNGVRIATLRGAQAGDRVGSGGVSVLENGHFVVRSPNWQHGAVIDAGAATWCDRELGCEGEVGAHNSLVGRSADDQVGHRVEALRDGNYAVVNARWDRDGVFDAGAVTFGHGAGGSHGGVDATNSLVGTQAFDQVGSEFAVLAGGGFVAGSPNWNLGTVENAGAATFARSEAAPIGEVSSANSLIGSSPNDRVGEVLWPLAHGGYVVASYNWNNGAVTAAGAATFGPPGTGVSGTVSATNSLVGTVAFSSLGKGHVLALPNGNYVVASPEWSDGSGANVGAVSFGSGSSGVSGVVSASNSLVGRRPGDAVGTTVVALAGGHYAVASPFWSDGAALGVGAVTFGDGTTGTHGAVAPNNSVIGTRANDRVGSSGVIALATGNYVIGSPDWKDAAFATVGAATFVEVASGTAGTVSAANSLVGSRAGDGVGSQVAALVDGGYVVGSPGWDLGAITNAGAATRAPASGIVGLVSTNNSLVGSNSGDAVAREIAALANGGFVVRSPSWRRGTLAQAGAVTFVAPSDATAGAVTEANSLVGNAAQDRVGHQPIVALPNANYLVESNGFDDGALVDAGAATLGLHDGRVVGPVDREHSVIGAASNISFDWSYAYDARRNQLVVGDTVLNRVIVHRSGAATTTTVIGDTPDPSLPGSRVEFRALVSAVSAPSNGAVRFQASDGQECTDASGIVLTAIGTEFRCDFAFASPGSLQVTAEYLDSLDFAYSGSADEPHTVLPVAVFGDGFELP
jgi:hypothetical protein